MILSTKPDYSCHLLKFYCSAADYTGPVEFGLSGTVLIEWVLSLRNELGEYFDLKIYIEIGAPGALAAYRPAGFGVEAANAAF